MYSKKQSKYVFKKAIQIRIQKSNPNVTYKNDVLINYNQHVSALTIQLIDFTSSIHEWQHINFIATSYLFIIEKRLIALICSGTEPKLIISLALAQRLDFFSLLIKDTSAGVIIKEYSFTLQCLEKFGVYGLAKRCLLNIYI